MKKGFDLMHIDQLARLRSKEGKEAYKERKQLLYQAQLNDERIIKIMREHEEEQLRELSKQAKQYVERKTSLAIHNKNNNVLYVNEQNKQEFDILGKELALWVYATESQNGRDNIYNERHNNAVKVRIIINDLDSLEEQIKQIIQNEFKYVSEGYSWDYYYEFDTENITINKVNQRNYVAIGNKEVKVGRYRPLKYDKAKEVLYAKTQEEFQFQIMNQENLRDQEEDVLCTDVLLRLLRKEKFIKKGQYEYGKLRTHEDILNILYENKLDQTIFVINDNTGLVSQQSHMYQVLLDEQHVYISKKHSNLFKEKKTIQKELLEASSQRTVMSQEKMDQAFIKFYENKIIPYTKQNQNGIQLILSGDSMFVSEEMDEIIKKTQQVFKEDFQTCVSLLPLLERFQDTDISVAQCYNFRAMNYLKKGLLTDLTKMKGVYEDVEADLQEDYLTIDCNKCYLTAFTDLEKLRYIRGYDVINQVVELHEFIPNGDGYYYFEIIDQESIKSSFDRALLNISNICNETSFIIFQSLIEQKVMLRIIYKYSTESFKKRPPKFSKYIQKAQELYPDDLIAQKKVIVSMFGIMQTKGQQFVQYSYYDEEADQIKQKPIQLFKTQYESNTQFLHCQMANQYIYNMFSDFLDQKENIIQIKTDAITFDTKQIVFNEQRFKVIPTKILTSGFNDYERKGMMFGKRVIQSFAGSGKSTYLRKYIGKLGQNEKVIVVVQNRNQKLQFRDLNAQVVCYQMLQQFNNINVLDDFDHILVDEFTMVELSLLHKLVYEYRCREGQKMVFCGDCYQQVNMQCGDNRRYKFMLNIGNLETNENNYRNDFNYRTDVLDDKGEIDVRKCTKLIVQNKLNFNEEENIYEQFKQGNIFICNTNDYAYYINSLYQKFVVDHDIQLCHYIRKDLQNKNDIDFFDSHDKDQYYNGRFKVYNYIGCAYTCYYAQGSGFRKLKISTALNKPEQIYVALSRYQTKVDSMTAYRDEEMLNELKEVQLTEAELQYVVRSEEYVSGTRKAYYKTGEEDDTCPICLEQYTDGERIIQTHCKHRFHVQCLNECLKNDNKCPCCRTEIK